MRTTLTVTFLVAFLIGFKATLFVHGKLAQHDAQIYQLQGAAKTGLRAVKSEFHLFQGEYSEVSKRQTRDESTVASLFATVQRDEKAMRRIRRQVQKQASLLEGMTPQ